MVKKSVVINKIAYRHITDLLLEKSDIELVSLGFGFFNESQILITNFVRMRNLDESPISFSLDYEEMYKEIQNHEKEGKSLIGFFHSHPHDSRLYPSQKDIHFMRNWPYPYLWLLGSSNSKPNLMIYALVDEKIQRIDFSVKEF
ncbi:MAG: Mov34/MPN/PAD-1 family protein [Candidatus Hodarchaeota archaeon]